MTSLDRLALLVFVGAIAFWLPGCGKPGAPGAGDSATPAARSAGPTPNPRLANEMRFDPVPELPPEWPEDLLSYPGMELVSVHQFGQTRSVKTVMDVTGTRQEVLDHFARNLSRNGFPVLPPSGDRLMAMKQEGTTNRMVSVIVKEGDSADRLRLQVTYSEK